MRQFNNTEIHNNLYTFVHITLKHISKEFYTQIPQELLISLSIKSDTWPINFESLHTYTTYTTRFSKKFLCSAYWNEIGEQVDKWILIYNEMRLYCILIYSSNILILNVGLYTVNNFVNVKIAVICIWQGMFGIRTIDKYCKVFMYNTCICLKELHIIGNVKQIIALYN